MHYYRAYFKTKAKIISLPSNPKENNTINVRFVNRGKAVPIYAYKKAKHDLTKERLSLGWYNVGLWPRTDRQGNLIKGTAVTFALPAKKDEDFEELGIVIGRLTDAGSKRGVLVVEVYPNEQGKLKKSFKLVLKATDEVIDVCKELDEGEGIELICQLDVQNACLIAEEVTVVELPEVIVEPPPKRSRVKVKR